MEPQPPRAETALLGPRASPAPLWPLATCWRLLPTGTELGVQNQMRDWESPTAASRQAATHLPGSHQPPDTRQGSQSQSFLPFLRLWPHSRLGPVFQVPACPQSCCEAAPHRDTAGFQIHQETSVLLFPLHMHQAGESPPPRVLVLSRINTSAGTSSPTHQRGGVGSQCVSDKGRRQSASDHGRNVKQYNEHHSTDV